MRFLHFGCDTFFWIVRSAIVTLCTMASVNQSRLDLYLTAEAKILLGQSIQLDGRRVQRADLAEVRRQIGILQAAVARENALANGGGGRFSQASFSSGGCDSEYADRYYGRG